MAEPIPLITVDSSEPDARPVRADAAANRALILETADRLFAEQGVAEVTMADIAQAAEIGKGTLYRRFANKAELCLALMDTQMSAFQNRLLSELRGLNIDGASYLEQLAHYMAELVRFTEHHAPLLCEVEHGGLLLDNQHPDLPHYWHHMTVTGLLRSAQRRGEISADVDVEFMAEALLAPLQVDLLQFQRNVRGYSNERIISGLQSLISALGQTG